MTITSLEGRYLRVNRSFAAMVGRAREDLVGAHVRDVTHPDDAAADEDAIANMAALYTFVKYAKARFMSPGRP